MKGVAVPEDDMVRVRIIFITGLMKLVETPFRFAIIAGTLIRQSDAEIAKLLFTAHGKTLDSMLWK